MNDVKWIKIVTDIFDDEKIRYIETMPNGDTTIVIWFRLLCLAGKSNRGGMLMMTDRIHYTEEMLASIFGRDVKTIQLALNVFENLGMIEIVNQQSIIISNWNKHQSADKLVAMREANRIRNIEYRERKRDITRDAPVTSHDVTDIDIELDKEKEKELEDNTKNNTLSPKKKSTVEPKKRYGNFKHVLLTDSQLEALQQVYENWSELINHLDIYIEEKGYKSKNHYLTIRRWVVDAVEKRSKQ